MTGARLFGILCRLQTRRLINRLQDLRTRSLTLMALGSALLILSLMGLLLIMDRSVQRLLDANAVREVIQRFVDVTWDPLRFTRYEDVPDQGARLMLLFLNSTLLSALFLKWGHWQSLQRDEEWEWFAEQPCPAWALFVQRCWMESLWPQGFSLFIGAFFMLLGLQRGWAPLSAVGMTLVLVLTLQTLLAAPRLTLDLWLRLRWPAHRVRTLRGASGLIGAALLVLGLQALSIDQGWAVIAVMRMGSILDATPAALALSAVMLHDEAAALRHFASLLGIVVVIHLACLGWAAWALRRPTPGHAAWLGRSQDQMKQTLGLPACLWHRLHPLTRRDLTLLT
ncbi:MAG: hypothetical protein M3Q07_19170, partial [Pseudobdellovibrionaceae bacterium]|nr:hypothetical protein [Pseudobdellovibrionaceae bacterium]